MSKQSPVNSLARDDAIIGGQRNPTFYVKSPHPIFDGVVKDERNSKSRGVGNGTSCNFAASSNLPLNRSYYPTYSEFVNAKRNRDADTADDGAEEDGANVKIKKEESEDESGRPYLGRRMEMRTTMSHQAQQKDEGNLSDDEGLQNELDEIITEIPTLETYVPREPCYEKANAISFAQVCQRLEYLWKLRLDKKKVVTKQKKLECILPDALKEYLGDESPFPYLRLILAEHDSSRPHTGLKEARIAETWDKAMGCDKGTEAYKQLTGFRNSTVIKNAISVGDLSCVVQDVMTERMPGTGSKLTVGDVNEWLDVLVDIVKDKFGMTVEDRSDKSVWRKSLEKAVASKKAAKKHDQYAVLVEKLIDKNMNVSKYLSVLLNCLP
jgi:hypothetical protein